MNKIARRAQNKSARRKAILDAALTVFSRDGYSGAHMETVATSANVSKPTLYHYFPSKEVLFIAVLEAKRDDMLTAIEAANSDNMIAQLYNFSRSYARNVLRADMLSLARLIIGEAQRFPEIGRAYQAAGPDKLLQGIKTYLTEQRTAGNLVFKEADLAAEDLWALILSAPRNRALHDPEWRAREEDIERQISHGLLAFLKLYSTAPDRDAKALAQLTEAGSE